MNKEIVKNRYLVLACLLCMVPGKLFSQVGDTACDCEAVFEELTRKLEANYIGLKHFQELGKGPEYEQRKAAFAARSGAIDGQDCARFLQDFLDYFEDGHLYVIERPKFEGAKMDAIEADIESKKEEAGGLLDRLKSQKASLPDDPVPGEYTDGTSDFVVLKEGDAYTAYILRSEHDQVSPGEIKARFSKAEKGLRGTYYAYDHTPRFMKGGLYKDGTLLKVEGSIWIKTDSDKKRELGMVNFEAGNDWPTVQKLDEENVLMSIPRFSVDYQIWKDVVNKHKETLSNARNLIIDIRGNRGGNAIYFSIFDLFSDQERKGGQGHVLASEDNKAYFSRYGNKIYKAVVTDIEQHMGEIVDGPDYPDNFIKRNKRSKVEQVAILTDHACMSAAESFILHAKASSSLVRTFGSPTAGVIDYTSVNAIELNSGDQHIYFGYPTSTLHKDIPENGFNKTGIIPDVPIDEQVFDKVAFIMDYYRKAK